MTKDTKWHDLYDIIVSCKAPGGGKLLVCKKKNDTRNLLKFKSESTLFSPSCFTATMMTPNIAVRVIYRPTRHITYLLANMTGNSSLKMKPAIHHWNYYFWCKCLATWGFLTECKLLTLLCHHYDFVQFLHRDHFLIF